jgi:zinc finger CCHC domain-containing protein 9
LPVKVTFFTNLTMTRVTDFGRKRTYLEAGFGSPTNGEKVAVESEPSGDTNGSPDGNTVEVGSPSQKKRKRAKKPKKDGSIGNGIKEVRDEGQGKAAEGDFTFTSHASPKPAKKKEKDKRQKSGCSVLVIYLPS